MYPGHDREQDLRQPHLPAATPVAEPDRLTTAIANATDVVIASRVIQQVVRKEGRMSLMGKVAALTERAQDFTTQTEKVFDGIADKITAAEQKRDVAAQKHHAYYDTVIRGVDDSIAAIDRLSNGPLPEGGQG